MSRRRARMNRGDEEKDGLVLTLAFVLVISTVALLVGYTFLFSWGISLSLIQFARLATMQDGRCGPFRWWFHAALAAWWISFAMIYSLNFDASEFVLGMPPATSAMLWLFMLAPLLLVTLPYGIHFTASAPNDPLDIDESTQVGKVDRR